MYDSPYVLLAVLDPFLLEFLIQKLETDIYSFKYFGQCLVFLINDLICELRAWLNSMDILIMDVIAGNTSVIHSFHNQVDKGSNILITLWYPNICSYLFNILVPGYYSIRIKSYIHCICFHYTLTLSLWLAQTIG